MSRNYFCSLRKLPPFVFSIAHKAVQFMNLESNFAIIIASILIPSIVRAIYAILAEFFDSFTIVLIPFARAKPCLTSVWSNPIPFCFTFGTFGIQRFHGVILLMLNIMLPIITHFNNFVTTFNFINETMGQD